MEELLLFLNKIASSEGWPLSQECLSYLREVTGFINLRKDQYLLQSGQICRNLYFIRSGLLKCFYVLHGEQVSDWFFGEQEAVVSIDSFYDQVAGEDYIQALEDCELYFISFEKLTYLYKHFVEFNVIGRVLTNKYLRIWHRQARNIRMLTAEERFIHLMQRQPELFNRVPIKDLASYLDMSRETLSRMRRRGH